MSEHPIDVLRSQRPEAGDYEAEFGASRGEQLEPLLRDAGEALRAAHDPERWGDFLSSQVDDLLVRIDAALALFDRKEQT